MTDNNESKNINNIDYKSYKDLYSNKGVFLELLKKKMKKPWIKDLKLENLTLINKSYIESDYEGLESDVVYSADINGGKVIFYVLLEYQSTIDYEMPLRLFFYITEILKEYDKNAGYMGSDKNIKIPAVIPIVLYDGNNKGDVNTSFKDIVYNAEMFGHNIMNFDYDIFDVNYEYEIGKAEAKMEAAKNLLDVLDDETISLKTGIDIEIIKKLRSEI